MNSFEDPEKHVAESADDRSAIESTDKSIFASIGGVVGGALVMRPQEDALYELYFVTPDDAGEEKEEIAFVSSDTERAEKEFGQITAFLRRGSWKTREDAKRAVRDFIVNQLHGGIQETR